MDNQKSIVISSTFAAEPLREPISFWLDRLELVAPLIFAPELQLIQNLLDAHSPLNTNTAGLNVVLLRWQDLDAHGRDGDRPFTDLIGCLRASVGAEIPLLIVTCPPSPGTTAATRMNVYADWDRRLAREIDRYPNQWVTVASHWQDLYPVASPYEPGGDDFTLLPYSAATFAVLGTLIIRKFHMLTTAPYKVIAVDCDDTLWDGACGEDGPLGVGLNPPHVELQQFLLSQLQQGCLLCLCSKNNPEDVEAVFRERPDMPLRWEHIAAFQLNWKPKPENLLAIAEELGLGTDSFIFIDDNPIECEMMRQSLPNVLTLQLPSNRSSLQQFLRRVWAFDRPAPTEEDKQRMSLYQREREREQLLQKSATLEEFIAGLELYVEFKPLNDENLCRASQLTFRVNQFNVTTIRRTEAELATLLREGSLNGLAVDVSDRFGEYGFVGLILFASTFDALQVDTFLLSCRALGRGVEHRMLAELGEVAKCKGLRTIGLRLIPTSKNQPARDFLEEDLGSYQQRSEGYVKYRVPVDAALAIRYRPGIRKEPPAQLQVPGQVTAVGDETLNMSRGSRLAWIASEMLDADKILAAIQAWRQKERPGPEASFISSRTDLERMLAGIWADVLGLEKVSVRDNFFELGGDSLAMVRAIIQLYEVSGVEFSVASFFESPIIEELAIKLARLDPRCDD